MSISRLRTLVKPELMDKVRYAVHGISGVGIPLMVNDEIIMEVPMITPGNRYTMHALTQVDVGQILRLVDTKLHAVCASNQERGGSFIALTSAKPDTYVETLAVPMILSNWDKAILHMKETCPRIKLYTHYSENHQMSIRTRCENCGRVDSGTTIDTTNSAYPGSRAIDFLRRSFMCCPTYKEDRKVQDRIRNNWDGYMEPREFAVAVMRRQIKSSEYRSMWQESNICYITPDSAPSLGILYLRPVSQGQLGPQFALDVSQDCIAQGEFLLLAPTETERVLVAEAVRVAQAEARKVASARTSPWWDPYL